MLSFLPACLMNISKSCGLNAILLSDSDRATRSLSANKATPDPTHFAMKAKVEGRVLLETRYVSH